MIAAKKARLDEIIGHLKEEKEEELEGEELGEIDTGNVLLSFFYYYYDCTDQISLVLCFIFTVSPLFLDDSNEGERRPLTKEEEDIDILHSWMEVGGNQLSLKGRHKGC